jgi:hypothetical protein
MSMGTTAASAAMWHPKEATLLGLTLITSAAHLPITPFASIFTLAQRS